MDHLSSELQQELPPAWATSVDRSDGGVVLQCEHAVLGGHEFRWETASTDQVAELTSQVLDRLDELGLLAASRSMPSLSDSETETLREAHAMIDAARFSKEQARSVVGMAHALGQLSNEAAEWALDALDLLEPWYRFPPEPEQDR